MNEARVATIRLVCPQCRTGLVEAGEQVVCTNADCRAAYPVADGLWRFVPDDSTTLEVDAWQAVTRQEEESP